MTFGILDIITLVVIAGFALYGLLIGFLKSALRFLPWLLGIVVPFFLGTTIIKLFFPRNNWNADTVLYVHIAIGGISFLLGFLIIMLLDRAIKISGLSAVDRLIGLVFGVLRGLILVYFLFEIVKLLGNGTWKWLSNALEQNYALAAGGKFSIGIYLYEHNVLIRLYNWAVSVLNKQPAALGL